MPDLRNFAITTLTSANVNVPRATIACQVFNDDGTLLMDLTGASAITFPGVLTTLTAAQRRKLVDIVSVLLVRMVAGLDDGSR